MRQNTSADTTSLPEAKGKGNPIRIVVADDHPIVREGLAAVLGTQPDFNVIGQVGSGADVVTRVTELEPDVLLLDLEMPDMDGVEALRRLRESHVPVRVIVFTAYDTDERILGAVRAGAQGYLLKGVASRGGLSGHPGGARRQFAPATHCGLTAAPAGEPGRHSRSGWRTGAHHSRDGRAPPPHARPAGQRNRQRAGSDRAHSEISCELDSYEAKGRNRTEAVAIATSRVSSPDRL